MLLYDSRLHLFSGKLQSRWTGPYDVKKVYPHGAVEIEDPTKGTVTKVNEQRLKPSFEGFGIELVSILLENPTLGVVQAYLEPQLFICPISYIWHNFCLLCMSVHNHFCLVDTSYTSP